MTPSADRQNFRLFRIVGSLMLAIAIASCDNKKSESPAPTPVDPAPPAAQTPTPNTHPTSGPWVFADPNPVPAGPGNGTTTISWTTGDKSGGQVYVTPPGESEKLFSASGSGSKEIHWIGNKGAYRFALYAGKDHQKLLSEVSVSRGSAPATPAAP